MYAILDIETTGGKFNEEGITEIAIYKFDGHQVVDKFVSLVNPEKNIQPFVVNLTGITDEMVRNAPIFSELSKRIIEITKDCILVAHNANFDFRILSTEFRRIKLNFQRKTICTVELSKELIPDLPSYKLCKLCNSLAIPISGRHRAEGDAMATVQLFKMLLSKDVKKSIIKKAVKTDKTRSLAPKLTNILYNLPNKTGVFYVHNGSSKILYIGHSKNIRKSVNQLFLGDAKRTKLLRKEISSVTYEETGSRLIAQLKYEQEKSFNKPLLNSKLNKTPSNINFNNDNLLLIDKGRDVGEKSVLMIENNELKGYCFTDLSYQTQNIDILRNLISPMKDSSLNRNIIKDYLDKNRIKKLVRF